MRAKTIAFRLTLSTLLLAALACNAVTNVLGGDANSRIDDAQATADALATDAASQFDNSATPVDEEPTEEVIVDEETTNEEPIDEEPVVTEDAGTNFGGGGPDDVPVMDGEHENFYASAEVVTYLTTAAYADVLAFYKTEMEKLGWTFDANLSTEFGEIAALTYHKDSRTATLSILTDVSSGKTLVAVNIAEN